MYRFETERLVSAPASVAWDVISDAGNFAEVAPNLSRSEILSGKGEGMCRRCYDKKGRGWNENCVLWREGKVYAMEVDTGDYPYPLSKMQGTWGVEESDNGTIIKMKYEYAPKYGPANWLIDRLVIKRVFSKTCEQILDNWEAKVNERMNQKIS